MSIARLAHASALRGLQSQLGPPSSDHASTNIRAQLWKLQTDRQRSDDVEKERALGDAAGVGATANSNSSDAVVSATITSAFGVANIDATLREQLLKPSLKAKQAVQNSTRKAGVRDPHAESRKHEDEISSEDDQGRSNLGRSVNVASREKFARQPRKKKAKIEVETFESMQSKDDGLVKKEDSIDEAKEDEAVLPLAKFPTRPKSYLDEALEARRRKQERKKIKKEKQKSVQ